VTARSRAAATALGALALAGVALFAARGVLGSRPHLVLVVWDTCRVDRLSAYGYDRPTTPRLERLAAEGVRFERAFSPSSWTPPAHASLFTGLLPRRHGLLRMPRDRVRPGVRLLAETLRDAGYATVGFTANSFLSPVTGLSEGFERMALLYTGTEAGKADGASVAAAVEGWCRERKAGSDRRPLFLFVNLMDAHLPRRPAPAAVKAVGPAAPGAAVERAAAVNQRRAIAHMLGVEKIDAETLAAMGDVYDAAVRELDEATGRILDALEGAGLLRDALVAVVADHGENLGEHGELDHMASLYDPLLRVPLVIRWPGRFEGGRVEKRQVCLQDLHPTLLEAARVAAPPGTARDAVSLTEEPRGPRTLLAEIDPADQFLPDLRREMPGAAEFLFDRFRLRVGAARDPDGAPGARKYLRFVRAADEGPETLQREELYDLAADPGETRDLMRAPGPGDREAAARLLRLFETGR